MRQYGPQQENKEEGLQKPEKSLQDKVVIFQQLSGFAL